MITEPKSTTSTTPSPVSILVYRNDLKSVVGDGLPKVNWIRRKKLFRTWKRILVEPAPAGVKDSIFFAPDRPITDTRATPTEFVNIDPEEHHDLVHQGDDFEVSFVGMSVSPQDCLSLSKNELLLYSLTREDIEKEVAASLQRASLSHLGSPPPLIGMKKKSMKSSYYTRPTGFSPSLDDSPFIHYDPVIDGHDVGSEPDAFVPIPASKSLYLQKHSRDYHHKYPEKSLSLRFSVMEIDKVSDTQVRAIAGIGDMGHLAGEGAAALPYLELLSGAFEITSLLGKKGLETYSRPDHVMSKDVEFKLAPPVHDTTSESSGEQTDSDPRGQFLRYGYYFFLSKSIDARVYAQTGSSTQHVPLLLKRENFDPKTAPKNEKPYFPLTGVSYVVVKVSRGVSSSQHEEHTKMRTEHRRRLDSMLQMSSMMETFANFEGANNTWPRLGGTQHRQRQRQRRRGSWGKRRE